MIKEISLATGFGSQGSGESMAHALATSFEHDETSQPPVSLTRMVQARLPVETIVAVDVLTKRVAHMGQSRPQVLNTLIQIGLERVCGAMSETGRQEFDAARMAELRRVCDLLNAQEGD